MVRFADCPAAIVIGNIVPITLKPAPLVLAPVTDSAAPPVFETRSVCVVVVFTSMLPKLMEVTETAICAGAATVTVAEADFVVSATLVAFTV